MELLRLRLLLWLSFLRAVLPKLGQQALRLLPVLSGSRGRVLLMAVSLTICQARTVQAMAPADFINMVLPWAQAANQRFGIPISVEIAQAADESGWGQYAIDNTYFNVGCSSGDPYENGCYNSRWATYATPQNSFYGYAWTVTHGDYFTGAIGNKIDCRKDLCNSLQFLHDVAFDGFDGGPGANPSVFQSYYNTCAGIISFNNLTKYDVPCGAPPAGNPPSVNFNETNKNKWFGPADLNTQIVPFTLQDQGGGNAGLSQNWDSDPGGSSPQFAGSGGGYLTFGYLPDNQREGQHTAFVRTWNSDKSKTQVQSSGWYGYDSTPPTVTLTGGPAPGSVVNTASTVTWHIDDPSSGIDMWGQAWDADPGKQYNTSDGNLPIPEGTHTLHVHTWDKLGNNKDWTFGPFTLDTAVPSVSLLNPPATNTCVLPQSISWNMTDSGTGVATAWYAWDGNAFATCKASDNSAIPTSSSQHTLHLKAQDGAGNVQQQDFGPFQVDPNPPAAPTGFSVTPGNLSASLKWTAPVQTGCASIAGYNIYRRKSGDPNYTLLNSAVQTGTTFTDTVPNGVSYDYGVTAVDSFGREGALAEVKGTVIGPVNSPPTWQPTAFATGPDNIGHIVWQRTDGLVSLWNLTADGTAVASSHNYGPSHDWSAIGLTVGPDSITHILWRRATDGLVDLWNMTADQTAVTSDRIYGPSTAWVANGLAVGRDGITHILWRRTVDGLIDLWNMTPDQTGIASDHIYGSSPDWTTNGFAVGPDGITHILWRRTADGFNQLWNMTADQTGITSARNYGASPDWMTNGLSVGPDGITHILWNRTADGLTDLWNMTPDQTAIASDSKFGSG